MENERGLTLTGGCTRMVGEREYEDLGNERGLTLTGGCTRMVGEREGT